MTVNILKIEPWAQEIIDKIISEIDTKREVISLEHESVTGISSSMYDKDSEGMSMRFSKRLFFNDKEKISTVDDARALALCAQAMNGDFSKPEDGYVDPVSFLHSPRKSNPEKYMVNDPLTLSNNIKHTKENKA